MDTSISPLQFSQRTYTTPTSEEIDLAADKKLFSAFLRQLLDDALLPDNECSGNAITASRNRRDRDEAINFFFSTSADVSVWRESVIRDYLGYPDVYACLSICRELINKKDLATWKKMKRGVRL